MFKVVYSKLGYAVSDFELEEFVENEIKCFLKEKPGDWLVEIANETALMAFQVKALKGEIPTDRVEFYYEDTKLDFSMISGLTAPKGCDDDIILMSVLTNLTHECIMQSSKNFDNRVLKYDEDGKAVKF